MVFFVLARFVLVKYSRAFVERPSQGTSSLASRLTTVSLDSYYLFMDFYHMHVFQMPISYCEEVTL